MDGTKTRLLLEDTGEGEVKLLFEEILEVAVILDRVLEGSSTRLLLERVSVLLAFCCILSIPISAQRFASVEAAVCAQVFTKSCTR